MIGSEQKRIRGKDWVKAILCSILLLLLILFFWPRVGGGAGGGEGTGFGFSGFSSGGLGFGFGIGKGDESGASTSGTGNGSEASGEFGGGESDRENSGGETLTDAETTFGDKENGSHNGDSENGANGTPSRTDPSADGRSGNGSGDSDIFDPGAKKRVSPGSETLALIQPDSAPPAASETGNRYVGGRGASGHAGGNQAGRNIGGMNVRGSRLGVILDVSGSMSPYLEELRAEIQRQYSNAVFLEVSGCSLRTSKFDAAEFRNNLPDDNERRAVMDCFRELLEIHGVDAIYWFCDLQDRRETKALTQLRSLIWGKDMPPVEFDDPLAGDSGFAGLDKLKKLQRKARHTPANAPVFRLYIRSTDEFPGATLQAIIDESGGQFQKKN